MLGANTDGVGYCYVDKGEFIIKKYPYSLEKVLKNKKTNKEFLSHLPFDGITVVHIRSSSVGHELRKSNTHPFLIEDGKKSFAIAHNGTYHEYGGAKLALGNTVKFFGNTDSEVCGQLIRIAGVRKFTDEVDGAGVFMVLNKLGELTVIKTSGELSLVRKKGGRMLLASELDFTKYPRQLEALLGYYRFDKNLRYVSHRQKKSQFKWTPAKTATAYEGSFGGEQKIDSTPTVTTWVHDKATGNMIRKVEKLTNFRAAGMYGEHGYNHIHDYMD